MKRGMAKGYSRGQMVISMKENGKMGNQSVIQYSRGQMVTNMKVDGKMRKCMEKEHSLFLVDTNM